MDGRPGADGVRDLLDQPGRASHAHKDFNDYLQEGPLAALDAIEKATGEKEVNALGYCLGGTLLAIMLAYMAAKKDKRIVSATFMTSLTDFSNPGELGVFIDEGQLDMIDKRMIERGFLEGSEMAETFNMLRGNDLIWSFVINNYLMGRDPFPFDLLHWNTDATRMPARMHSYYLRNMYLNNRLREPGGITLDGVPIDLSKVTVPTYFAASMEDHIAPWKSTYHGPQLMRGKGRFVLSGSGHIAGMINPPSAKKYGFWTNDALPESAGRVARRRQAARGLVVERLAAVARRSTPARRSPRACPARASSRSSRRPPGATSGCGRTPRPNDDTATRAVSAVRSIRTRRPTMTRSLSRSLAAFARPR